MKLTVKITREELEKIVKDKLSKELDKNSEDIKHINMKDYQGELLNLNCIEVYYER